MEKDFVRPDGVSYRVSATMLCVDIASTTRQSGLPTILLTRYSESMILSFEKKARAVIPSVDGITHPYKIIDKI